MGIAARSWWALALALLCLPAAGAWAQTTAPQGRLDAALAQHHVIPRYGHLAATAAALRGTAEAFCAKPDKAGLEATRAGFHRAMDAWMGVQHIRFGPGELFMRVFRLQHWPDKKNIGGRQLEALLAARDDAALAPEKMRSASVAVQGLSALERLLFGKGGEAALLAAGSDAGYRCRLLVAIAANVAKMSADILAEWQGGGHAAATAAAAGYDGDEEEQEAVLEYFKSFYGSLQFVGELKLQLPLGRSLERSRPRLAESWRSRRSLRNVIVNLEALEQMYLGEGGPGFAALVAEREGGPQLDAEVRAAFVRALATAREIARPLAEAVGDPEARPKVERLRAEVLALRDLARSRLAPALGLPVGFNSFDGD